MIRFLIACAWAIALSPVGPVAAAEPCRIKAEEGQRWTRLSGPCRKGLVHGRGKAKNAAGHRYEGDFVEGVMQGRGTYVWPDGRRYEGGFKKGQRDGAGVYTWPDGKRCECHWKKDRIDGRGTLWLPDGSRYDGPFVDDRPHGWGGHDLSRRQEGPGSVEERAAQESPTAFVSTDSLRSSALARIARPVPIHHPPLGRIGTELVEARV